MAPEVSDVFSKLDPSKKSYLSTKHIDEQAERRAPRMIKLPKGTLPKFIELTKYQMFCWKVMGDAVLRWARPNPRLELQLQQAQLRMRVEEYTAYVWMSTLLVFAVALAVAGVLGGIMLAVLDVPVATVLIFVMLAIMLPPIMTYGLLMATPSSRASTRARDINKRIGPAMSFISAMASANVNVDVIFKELARQDIYGEIKNEAEWITRDTELLGIDILTAITKAAQRTPSVKFQEFLQGVVTTSTSGGELKPYFLQKAEQFEKEGKLEMRSQLETLGLMAESFVTVVVAFPLFLVIIMAIMAIVPGGGGSSGTTILLLELVIGLMIPFSQFGFIFYIWNMTKESSF